MQTVNSVLLSLLIPVAMLTACSGNDTIDPPQDNHSVDNTLVEQGLLTSEWTLETVRDSEGLYRPLPLEATWRLRFAADGSVSGNALCNGGVGDWQADDATISIANWTQTEIDCDSSHLITIATDAIVSRLFTTEMMMPSVNSGRLFLDAGDNAQLVFSGRVIQAEEQAVSIEALVRTVGSSRASDGNPALGDLATPYVIYRDAESLNADIALLPVEETQSTTLPPIDFSNNIVVGIYLPLDSSISSDVVVRNARESDTGLEIEAAYFSPNIPNDTAASNCAADAALSAPWTLVRIESVEEPVRFAEMARSYCSGIPTPRP